MALDPLEKEHLRRKMAERMGIFLEGASSVTCVSGHYYPDPHDCELCGLNHANEILVIKNRSSKKLHVASKCLLEMIRFKVTDADEITRWLEKIRDLKSDHDRRQEEQALLRQEERKRLEKKVIVRKRNSIPAE